MFAGRLLVFCLVLCVPTACARMPTGPTAVAPAATLSVVQHAEIPNPSGISISPPRALGVTRYLAFGDSITWGATAAFYSGFVFAAANGGYPERLVAALNGAHAPQQFTVFNEGLPGELALSASPRLRSLLTSRRPECVLLLEGVNDLSNDVDPIRVAGAVFQLVDTATAMGASVVVATMYPTYPVTDPDGHFRHNGAAHVPAFNAEVRRLAAQRLNVHLVDLEGVMSSRSLVGTDGIHLTDAGFDVMASAFQQRIEAAYPVRGSFQ